MKRIMIFGGSILIATALMLATTDFRALAHPCITESYSVKTCPTVHRLGFPFTTDGQTRIWQSTVALNFLILLLASNILLSAIVWVCDSRWGKIYKED